MPKVPERKPLDRYGDFSNLDSNAPPGGKEGPIQPNWTTYQYAFLAINEADFPEEGYPEFIVQYIDFRSLSNSLGGCREWVKANVPKGQSGVVVRLDVRVTQECVAIGEGKAAKAPRKKTG